MRRKDQRMRVADDDSDTDTIRGDNAENEVRSLVFLRMLKRTD